MALEQSRFWDYTEEHPNEYQADEFAEYFRAFLSDGVPVMGTNLEVTAPDTGMLVNVNYGSAMVQGYGYWLKDDETGIKQLDIVASHATYTRIDRVVLRRDKSVSVASTVLAVLTGTPSAMPVPPELTRAGNIFEISLAQVRVDPGVLSIAADKVTDERENTDVCGYVENLSVREQLTGKAPLNHTQAISTITGLVDALAGKAAFSHTQAMDTITGLVTALAGKAALSHTQAMDTITGLVTALAGKLSTNTGAVGTANIANGAVTNSKLGSDAHSWHQLLADVQLDTSGQIDIASLSGYSEVLIQVKNLPGDDSTVKGFGILTLNRTGSPGIGYPKYIKVPIAKTDMTMTYRMFMLTMATRIFYSLTSDTESQYLCLFAR